MLIHFEGLGDPELDGLRLLIEDRVGSEGWHRLLGLLTAIASAPSAILVGDWVRVALEPLELGPVARERAFALTLRFFAELCAWLDGGTAVAPPSPEGVDAFCRGYAEGIELDPHWRRSPGLLALALPMVVLGGLRPLSAFAPRYREDLPLASWVARARIELTDHILAVYEAMRASGAELAESSSCRSHQQL